VDQSFHIAVWLSFFMPKSVINDTSTWKAFKASNESYMVKCVTCTLLGYFGLAPGKFFDDHVLL